MSDIFIDRIPVMPVRSTVLFPTGATALQVSFAPNVEVLTRYPKKDLVVAMVATSQDEMPIDATSLEKVATAVRVVNRLNLPGGLIQVTLQGLIRVRLTDVQLEGDYYTAQPELVEEQLPDEEGADALIEKVLSVLGGVATRIQRIPDEAPKILRVNVGDPARFADLVATLCNFSVADRDEVLQRLNVCERLHFVLEVLERAWDRVLEADAEGGEAAAEPRPEPAPATRRGDRAAQLRERIRSLQAELGELDPAEREALQLLRRIDRARLPARAAAAARREAERVRGVSTGSQEAAEIRTYVETLVELPWTRCAGGEAFDLNAVREAMERKLGLEDAKRRLLEALSVAKLRGHVRGLVPCLVGPPEVGKRSLAGAIARGLNRPLVRIDLGGRGEGELAGTRRSRAGAQLGKVMAALRDGGVRDPVILFEELDEIGLGNVEGDPIEVMEELLDNENRGEFVDRYLDVAFDLSDALILATANDFFRVPRSLRDHLIEIRIAGYTPEDKVEIARERMLPKLIQQHGLEPTDVEMADDTLLFLTRGYAREAGLGSLRRTLSAILRYIAYDKANGVERDSGVTREVVEKVLGIPRYSVTLAESAPEVGVVTGLAWTASGGELMFIEALKMPGTGRLIITGLLGEVMRESVNAAYSYVRSRADALGIARGTFSEYDIHVHFPVGATPKDGPSAGAAVTLAVASSLADRPVRHDVAMTGEVTLRGKILDIGGVKEKTLAAHRAGLHEIILPHGNERDLRDVPQDVREKMRFHFVGQMDEIFELALLDPRKSTARRRGASRAGTGSDGARRVAEPAGESESAGTE
jgi:ATP-dependent Lon protease